MSLYVDENVLIPRPETEELVAWVLEDGPEDAPAGSILDIGTGSGCIPIALKKRLPQTPVSACDISVEALTVARRNAATHGTPIDFFQLDFLDYPQRASLPQVRVLVSNPPYIPPIDKDNMAPNVLRFEPHLALFVNGPDPMLFYRAIAGFAKEKGLPGGTLYVELHEKHAGAVTALFREAGLNDIILKKDMQGKDRMIKATW